MKLILEGSNAIAKIIKLIKPSVISAYPITPQTHIVEDLAKMKADGEADWEYVRAESEFAAASIVLGASATGERVYTATSSQGLLLMTEVLFNIAGMRLPVVLTCANRGVSAPITIWNDHQDAMTVRDAGWLMFFAEDAQEAVDLHVVAYKIAEQLRLPVMVNVDGFVLTHTYSPVQLPTQSEVNKFLPRYKPALGTYLNPVRPVTMGAFATPAHYMEIREELHEDVKKSEKIIRKEIKKWNRVKSKKLKVKRVEKLKVERIDTGLVEYYGAKKPEAVFVGMGSMIGTIKDFIDNTKEKVGALKIRSFRPLPVDDIVSVLQKAKYVAILDKSVSLGREGILAVEIKSLPIRAKVQSFIVGLGGRDITSQHFQKILKLVKKKDNKEFFVG